MTKAKTLLDLLELNVSDYVKGIGLKARSIYWADNLQGEDCKVAVIIYSAEDQGQQEFSLKEVFTQALLNALPKYIKPDTVKQIQSGEIQFQPISDKPIEANRILVVDSLGTYLFWGDFVR